MIYRVPEKKGGEYVKINKWKEKKKQPDERQLEITRLHEQYRQATAICGADAPETLACIEKLHQNTSNFIHKFIWDHGPGVQTKDVHNELYNILYITFREALPSYTFIFFSPFIRFTLSITAFAIKHPNRHPKLL